MTAPRTGSAYGVTVEHLGASTHANVCELVVPAVRLNPRRAHLLVSTVLGKHLPAHPATITNAANRLGDLVDTSTAGHSDHTIVIGFAETATGLGHAVATRTRAHSYLHSTRRQATGHRVAATFEETHSHATSHLLLPAPGALIDQCEHVVLVDDEITTGQTALAAIIALHARRPRSSYAVASLVDFRTSDAHHLVDRTAEQLQADIRFLSLARGRAVVPPDLVTSVQALPEPVFNPRAPQRGSLARTMLPWPPAVPDGGRHGFLASDTEAFNAAAHAAARHLTAHLDPSRPTIVIGHEELMYLPLMLAQCLAASGMAVCFQSTTRSPAYISNEPGYPLQRGFRFGSPELGETQPRYLYNASWPQTGLNPQIAVVIDAPANTSELTARGGLVDVLTAAGADVLVATLPAPSGDVFNQRFGRP